MSKELRLPLILSFLSTIFFLSLQVFDPPLIRELIEAKSLDLRFHLRGPQPASPDIVIVIVDEKSVAAVGRWPWSRRVMANLVDRVAAGRPRVVGIDILFSEPEGMILDQRLAQSIRKAGNVVLAAAFDVPASYQSAGKVSEAPEFLYDSALPVVKGVGEEHPIAAIKAIPPIESIAAASRGLGHVYSLPDRDGALRWETLYLQHDQDLYPSFALQVARLSLDLPLAKVVPTLGQGLRVGETFIPTDPWGRVLINYRGREGSFPYLPAVDVLKGDVPGEAFRDKIVLIGTSALGTYDQKITPLSANMPGVEKNATVVQNLRSGDFLQRSSGLAESAIILISGVALGLFLPKLRARTAIALSLLLTAGYILALQVLFDRWGIWLNFLYPTGNLLVIFTAVVGVRYITEERRARDIRRMFSSYVSPKIVDELIRHPEKMKLGGERRMVTVLFSDIRGFTTFCEKTSPERVIEQLNEYLTAMTEVIFRWDGTLDKFVGDEIMALWGAPLEQANHAELAVRCAVEMRERLHALQERWRSEGKTPLDNGIGVNSGEVLIGNIGAIGMKTDYTAIGDHINLGARVEGLTRNYEADILITEFTRVEIAGLIESGEVTAQEVAEVTVKGKAIPVRIYRVLKDRLKDPPQQQGE